MQKLSFFLIIMATAVAAEKCKKNDEVTIACTDAEIAANTQGCKDRCAPDPPTMNWTDPVTCINTCVCNGTIVILPSP